MAQNLILFCENVLVPFSRKSTKRYLELVFLGVKNAWKIDENYAFWPAPRIIHRPRPCGQTDAQNHAKWRQNASKITAKLAWKNMHPGLTVWGGAKSGEMDRAIAFESKHPGLTMVRNARRRLSCEKSSNCVHLCRSRCCFAHAMDTKIAKNCRKFTTKWPWKIRSPVLQW